MFLGTEQGPLVYTLVIRAMDPCVCVCRRALWELRPHWENFPCIEHSVLTPESFCVLTSVSLKVSAKNIKSEFLPI